MSVFRKCLIPGSANAFNSFVSRAVVLLLLVVVAAMPVAAQTSAVVQALQEHRRHAVQEKLFLHFDRTLYACGETMWFKVYNVDGIRHLPLNMSKVAYVEVLDETQKAVLQGKIALKEGTGNGSFVLPFTLNSGAYTVRAYTSWMKNFSPDFYFEQPVTILNTYKVAGLKPVAAPAYRLQLFPEGGNLVAGLQSKVAFTLTDLATGKGIEATGEVRAPDGKVVATFSPLLFGIGHFTFTPAPGSTYTAVVKVAGKQVLTQQLPPVYGQGFVLQLEEHSGSELKITIKASSQQEEPVYLLGHARQMISVAAAGRLQKGIASFVVAKDSLAEGITHFTLFNANNQPICERLYFKQPVTTLTIEAKAAKNDYAKREQVTLDLHTKSNTGSTSPADLSVAVYRVDETQPALTTDIRAYLWLTSELKGDVENASFYLSDTTTLATQALDNLMLTHGWSRFRWEDILKREDFSPAFLPEFDGHLVHGRIVDAATGASAPPKNVYLASPSRHTRLYHALSGTDGSLQFEVKDFFGQKEIVVQTDTRTDSTYRVEVDSPFSDKYSGRFRPLFDLQDSWHAALTLRHIEAEGQVQYFQKFRDRYKPPGIDSIAFYGKPDQQYFLDKYTRFKVMEEVLREYVTGVFISRRRGHYQLVAENVPGKSLFTTAPMILLDGVPVFNIDNLIAFDPLKVERLDVITNNFYHGPARYEGVLSFTTYKGDLAGFPLDPRALLLEYEGLQQQREFYAPAYATDELKQSRLPDFRNLLYWAPEVITGEDGKAVVSFYTSDSAGTYVVVVQGLTRDGFFGSKTIRFEVKQPL